MNDNYNANHINYPFLTAKREREATLKFSQKKSDSKPASIICRE